MLRLPDNGDRLADMCLSFVVARGLGKMCCFRVHGSDFGAFDEVSMDIPVVDTFSCRSRLDGSITSPKLVW